jgi:DHA1 family bicyclomycin/chloramphenicol resistance-like MFS transporter
LPATHPGIWVQLQMVTGAAVMAVAGPFADGAPQPMVIGIAACGVAAFLVAQIALRRSVKVPVSAGNGSVPFDH